MDSLWITKFTGPNGPRYGCRQTDGEAYTELYTWLNTVSYVCSSCDWPWDYFYFSNPVDEAEFVTRYGSAIREDE